MNMYGFRRFVYLCSIGCAVAVYWPKQNALHLLLDAIFGELTYIRLRSLRRKIFFGLKKLQQNGTFTELNSELFYNN